MKSFMAFLLALLALLLVDSASASWHGKVVNNCDFPLYAKTTNQLVGQKTDSAIVTIEPAGGTYDAAYLPTWGIAPGTAAKGVTIKLQTEDDPNFTAGHVYQIEYTHYQFKEIVNKLSVDLSVVDGNPLTHVSRRASVMVNDQVLDPNLCPKPADLGGPRSTLVCEADSEPCDWEWQHGHDRKLNGMPRGMSECAANNDLPHCSHPIECDAGPEGTVLFVAC